MNTSILLLCLATTALAIGEKQLKLEDIEKDNLANEKRVKQEKAIQATPQQKIISAAQLEYGFKPMKPTQQIYRQPQVPTYQYIYPQYTTQLAYTTPSVVPTVVPSPPQYQYQYQQYENVPYVVDNKISQTPRAVEQQQYYNQQYLYIQPIPASSNSIQMVVDPKGNVKYFMYVPTQYFSAAKNPDVPTVQVQSLTSNYQNVGPQIFTQEPDYQQPPNTESQYITQPQLPPQPITQQYVQSPPQTYLKTQYVQQEIPQRNPQPKSLLDSYVPSVLQLQYYKQQQEAQAVRDAQNVQTTVIRPQKIVATSAPKTVVTRTILKQSTRIPSASIETNFQLPSPYRAHTFKGV